MRLKNAAFVQNIVKKAQETEEPASADFGEKDIQKIENITNRLKDSYSEKWAAELKKKK
ncbi:MAG TPA: hypothetical protein HA224_00545 [Nanoarchaeota archaeon]|nr:hypothetical protein [Nanoarchaeota archaeon]